MVSVLRGDRGAALDVGDIQCRAIGPLIEAMSVGVYPGTGRSPECAARRVTDGHEGLTSPVVEGSRVANGIDGQALILRYGLVE